MTMRLALRAAVLCMAWMLTGCGEPESILTDREKRLGIEDDGTREFHSTLYFPKGVALRYPGYIIGIQKAYRGVVNAPTEPGNKSDYLLKDVAYFNREDMRYARSRNSTNGLRENLTRDPKALFIAHVTAHLPTVQGEYAHANECFVYNVLRSPGLGEGGKPDRTSGLAWRDCNTADEWKGDKLHWGGNPLREEDLYFNGVEALKAMGRAISREVRVEKYTHVLLIVMGWNTAQQEAVRNFNDLVGNIMAAAAEMAPNGRENIPSFRPLVIGVTWPSYWSTGFLNAFSYPNKADDADEIGLSWVNLLINDVLPEAITGTAHVADPKEPPPPAKKIPLVVIGHSFGARAATRAAFSGPALKCPHCSGPEKVTSPAALVVALQGAFSINRFIDGPDAGLEGAPYRDALNLPGTQFLLTASEHDHAAGGGFVFWYDPAGALKSYRKACGGEPPWQANTHFHCLRAREHFPKHDPGLSGYPKSRLEICNADDTGCGEAIPAMSSRRILYVDVSENVTAFNSPGSGGNAHSDIYRLSTGRLIWRAMQAAPAQ